MDYAERYSRNRVEYLYRLPRTEGLSPHAIQIGLIFATFMQPETREEVRPKYDWLMKTARIRSRTTLSKALKELRDEGFLTVVTHNGWGSIYSMPFDGESEWKGPERSLSP